MLEWLNGLKLRFKTLFRRRQLERDLQDELQFHVAMRSEQLQRDGTRDPHSAARRRFGNMTRLQDDIRERWTFAFLDRFWTDARFAWRLIAKNPWFTLVVVATLGVGIGVNNAMFTLASAMMGRSLPFEDPDRVVSVGTREPDGSTGRMSYLDYQDWQGARNTFTGLGAFAQTTMNLSDDERGAERFSGAFVSGNAFSVLRQQPMLGRTFESRDDVPGANAVVIIGSEGWKTRYHGDPALLGQAIRVNGAIATVIGIMPDEFHFPSTANIWQPLASMPGIISLPRDARELQGFGRLIEGVSLSQARAELDSIASRLSREYAGTNQGILSNVERFHPGTGPPLIILISAMMAIVGFVLLIACVNVANLLLSHSATRTREISIRLSLGATRMRLVRQLLVESTMLALLGGMVGLGLSMLGTRAFDLAVQNYDKPYWMRFTVDGTVLAYLIAICLGTGIVFGLAPALHASKTNVTEALKEGGQGTSVQRVRRWTNILVISEIAVTLVVIAGAGFMVRNFIRHYRLDHAIDSAPIMTMRFELPPERYATPESRMKLFEQLEERLRGIPLISSATIAGALPAGGGFRRQLSIDGSRLPAGDKPPVVTGVAVGTQYFDTIGLGLLRGRAFNELDGTPGREVAIVNQQFADTFLRDQQPIGRRIRLVSSATPDQQSPWLTVVGVSPTVRQLADGQPDPVVYVPYRSNPGTAAAVMVRTPSTPALIAPILREAVRSLDADLPVFKIMSMDDALSETRWPSRIFSTMFAIFACIGLVLSSVGLYAVTAYAVIQRTREIAIRIALGAQARQVLWLMFRRTIVQLGIGLAAGLIGAIGVGKMLQRAGPGISPYDPVTLVSIVLLLVALSATACYLPARRATRLDPATALRRD